jgi:plasmid stabilization system protein ParE
VIRRSAKYFGPDAAIRYKILIDQALTDLCENPARAGAKPFLRTSRKHWLYHLKYSRDRSITATGKVMSPRHYIVYWVSGDTLRVSRILHDSRDLPRHIL